MRTFAVLTAAAALLGLGLSAASASAQPNDRLTDAQYIAAARCAGLAQGSKLDTHRVDALLTRQQSRMSYVLDRADEARSQAKDQMRRTSPDYNHRLVAERDGSCAAYLN